MAAIQPLCQKHRESPVVAVCRRCREGMCDGCWRFIEADAPVCLACASFLGARRARIVSLTVSAILLAGVMTFFASRHMPRRRRDAWTRVARTAKDAPASS